MSDMGGLRDLVILLGFALASVLLFRRLGLGATLGYLVAGAIVGPHVLGLVGEAEQKISIAEIGITLLLFIVGLELNPQRLWQMRRAIFGFGLAQVVLCGVALSAILAGAVGFSPAAAIALGLPLALSSTAQVLPMLQSSGRLRTAFGERAFAVLLFQDLSIIALITIVAAMSRNPAAAQGATGWALALNAVIAMVGLIAVGRFVLRPLFRFIGNLGERELFIVAALFTVLAAAAVMTMLGLSPALGAFVAGVMLADTPYRHELEADVDPFRSILLGLFFLAVGMQLDLQVIAQRPLFVITMALCVIVVKAAVVFGLAKLARMPWRQALALGLLLSQGGEFGFVIFSQARDALLIEPDAASLFGAVVTLSMASTPFLMIAARPLRRDPVTQQDDREGPRGEGANALVVGYGRFGQTVAQMMMAAGIPVTLIDIDVEMIDVAGLFGAKVYFGDGTRIDLLRQAGAAEAEAILFCIDGDQLDAELIENIQGSFPNAAIYIRAFDRRGLLKLEPGAARLVIREVLESAVAMARSALKDLGVSGEEIARAESHYRTSDSQRLREQLDSGDIRVAMDRIITEVVDHDMRGTPTIAPDAAGT